MYPAWQTVTDVVLIPMGLALLYWIGRMIRDQAQAVLAAAKLVPKIATDVTSIKESVDHHGVVIVEHGERISFLEGKGNGSITRP